MRVNCQLVDAFIAVELNENKNRRRIFRSEMFERVNVTFFASRKIFGSLARRQIFSVAISQPSPAYSVVFAVFVPSNMPNYIRRQK